MSNPRRGFTLIELLISIAIIGILAALLIPNAITAIQKSKQKQTMNDIISIASGAVDYTTDHGEAPDSGNQSGDLDYGASFVLELVPTYLKSCPVLDQWNNPLQVYSGTSVAGAYGIPSAEAAQDDILIASQGRKGEDDGWTFDPNDPANGLYEIYSSSSYENDLININGSWLRGPRAGVDGTGTSRP